MMHISFSFYFINSDDYSVNFKPLEMYKKLYSKPQNMYFFYPVKLNWALDENTVNKNKRDTSFNKSKKSNFNENKSDNNDSHLNGRNIRSPLGTMRFGKRGQHNIPTTDEDFKNWIIYNKRTVKPNPLGTMRFGK
uniref:Uncharacterized protein n=2 Tax=Strongyloides stercoralis TaxID=6248 RepID=A0AAF5DQX4_STRER